MTWLLLSIFTNTALLLILKAFSRYGVNTLHGIVVNYITAAALGFFIFGSPVPLQALPEQSWLWIPFVLGFLFIVVFRLIARTAQEMGIAIATVANKMSVVMPVGMALIFFGEKLSLLQYAGMFLTLLAVYFTSANSSGGGSRSKAFWLPALIFLGSGLIDAIISDAGQRRVPVSYQPFFVSLSFFCAFLFGIGFMLHSIIVKKEKLSWRSIVGGLLLGIPNYFSIYGITRALESDFLPSAALYPVNNIGIVLVSAFGALLLFREKLSLLNWLGIALAVAAISLMAFAK